ncbi:hypothetical protein A9Q99_04845 [Gammaproteobacteria bacterium 45_16_T64]|nr:hypothetical protein A9Q99_04845 [Gammaproteobacteria bacterium 45_16_T64]
MLGISQPLYSIELKTSAQLSPPKYMKQSDGVLGGICIDIMNALEVADPMLKFTGKNKILPFKRLQHNLQKGAIDIFFGFKYTEKRNKDYDFITTPLYEINYVVAVKTGDDIKVNSFDDIRRLKEDGKILTRFGTAANKFLEKQNGLLVSDGAKSTSILLKKLDRGHGRFVFYHDLGLKHTIKEEGLDSKVKILPVSFLTYQHYAAVSKSTPKTTKDRVSAALEKIGRDGTLLNIHKKYGIN